MTNLQIGPDASHWNGHIEPDRWAKIFALPEVTFGWAKATQFAPDPEWSSNLTAFRAAADAGQIDFFGGYVWPTTEPVATQVARYLAALPVVVKDDPRFRWTIDCEGGTVQIIDQIAKALTESLGADRGEIYGGAYLRGPLGNPGPDAMPNAAKLASSILAGYVGSWPPIPTSYIPKLYVGRGPSFWQYSNGKSGPSNTAQFPRTIPGLWTGDLSCYWAPTAGMTYGEWLAATTPGMGDQMLDPKKDAATFAAMFAALTGFRGNDAGYWIRMMAGIGDVARGEAKRDLPDPYGKAFDWATEAAASGGGPHEHAFSGKTETS